MTIEKGQPWGSAFDGEAPELRAIDDADLARLADEHAVSDQQAVIAVGTGDVAATIGVDGVGLDPDPPMARHHLYPMDLGYVSLGRRTGHADRSVPFVSHVLGCRWPGPVSIRRSWRWPVPSPWPEVIVMNTPLAAGLRLGPRAHPNDGRLDVTVGSLPWRQTREAYRRAVSGSHLPHPCLDYRQRTEADFSADRPLGITIDGVDHGRWSWLSVRIAPDAYHLVARIA